MIAFDAFASGSALPGSSASFTHTCTGRNLVLFVFVTANGLSPTPPTATVTYNGVSMTLTNSYLVSGNMIQFVFTLINPATGGNTVAVSTSDAGTFMRALSVSYAGVRQVSVPDAIADNTLVPGTTITTNVVASASGSWLVSCLGDDGALASTAAGDLVSTRASLNNVIFVADSNGVVATGTRSATWTCSSQGLNCTALALAPYPDGGLLMSDI